ncbi:MAG: oligosaccharide flippase family protein [Saprospiraceae bacterium]
MKENSNFFNKIFRWQLVATLYIGIVQLVTIVLLGRFLPYKELGAFAIFQIVFRFALYSLDPGMFFSIIQKHESNKSLVKVLFNKQSWYILSSISVFILIACFTDIVSDIGWVILVNSLLIIFIIGYGSYAQCKLTVDFKQREIVVSQIIAYSIELIFVLTMCFRFPPMIIFTIGVVLRFLIFYSLCYYFILGIKKQSVIEIPTTESDESHVTLSKFSVWSQILSFIQGQYDSIIVISLFGLSTLGGYILMTEISYMIFAKINPLFNKAIIPVISKAYKNSQDTSELISHSLISYIYIIFIFYLLFWVYRTDLIKLAYPEKFQELVYFASYLIPIAFIKAMSNILISYLISLGESKRIFHWNIFILIANYIFILVFYWLKSSIDSFLIFGIVYSCLSLITVYLLLRRCFKLKKVEWINFSPQFYLTLFILFISVSGIKWLGFYFIWSIALSIFMIILCLLVLERTRVSNWFRLTIV